MSEISSQDTMDQHQQYDDSTARLKESQASNMDLHRAPTVSTLSPEMFEKLYLQPRLERMGTNPMRKMMGNPTVIGLCGHVLALTSLSMVLLNFQGATSPFAQSGSLFFCGGVMLLICCVFEMMLGNTFPAVVFASFGAFYLSAGYFYSPQTGISALSTEPSYSKGFGLYCVSWCMLCFLFTVAALRTNVIFVFTFLTLTAAFGILSASLFITIDNSNQALRLQKAAGGFCFACSLAGWYIFASLLLASLEFPFSIPVGDLSHLFPPRKKQAEAGPV